MSEVIVRQDFGLHRLVIACRCGKSFSLPAEGHSFHTCICGRTWENGYSDDSSAGKRFLAMHDVESWERVQKLRKMVDG